MKYSSITTKAELHQRINERSAYHATMDYTPNNSVSGDIRRNLSNYNEKRIFELNNRLKTLRQSAFRDHAKACLNGKAKGDFERTR